MIRKPLLVATVCGALCAANCSGPPGSSASSENMIIRETLITAQTVQSLAAAALEPSPALPADAHAEPGAYRVGAGDVLRITLQIVTGDEAPRMTSLSETGAYNSARDEYIVGPDGTIDYPFIGPFPVAGRTTFETSQNLAKELRDRKIYVDPFVNVRVADFRSQTINVTGEVKKPGALAVVEKPYTVLSAIQAVDGTLESADLSAAALIRADGKRIPLNLTRVLKGGAPEQNLSLLPGDTLHIPNNDANKVLVFGEVIKPQTITIESGKRQSMATALAQAGGWNPLSASMTHFYVLRSLPPEKSDPAADPQPVVGVYRLDASSADAWLLADQFTLRPRDVVYATTRSITEWNRFISQVIPTPFTYFFGGYTTYSDVGVQRP